MDRVLKLKKQDEVHQLTHQLEQERAHSASLRSSLESQLIKYNSMLQEKDTQEQEKDRQLEEKDRQLHKHLQEKDTQLQEKDRQLEQMARQLQETVRDQQETVRQLQETVKDQQETVRDQQETVRQLQNKEKQLKQALRQLRIKERQRKERWQQIACNVCKGQELARGAWGVVYEGMLPVAIKELINITPEHLKLFQREMDGAFFCHHPNIVQFLGAACDHSCPKIVMELMDGNLRGFIKHQNYRLQQNDIVRIALDVAKGLIYLHQHNPPILHRDLKTDNILLKSGTAKIGDLGSAKVQQDNMTPHCGTRIYTAPEVLDTNHQTTKMDVWSYGLVVQEMATGERPVPGQLAEQVQRIPWPKLKELVNACTQIQPEQRPPMAQVVRFLMENFT